MGEKNIALRDAIESTGLSVDAFAKRCRINGTLIYAAMNGDLKLSDDQKNRMKMSFPAAGVDWEAL